jgi:hypothetical protein
MSKVRINFLLAVALLVFISLACGRLGKNNDQGAGSGNSNTLVTTTNTKTKPTPNTDTEDDDASTSGTEKQKPAVGKGNVQGKVLFNDQPVEGIEVRLCENFSTIMGIKCDGKTKTTKTGADGVYVLADLEPLTYGGLTAKVFKSNYYVYPYKGLTAMTAQKFTVEGDKTIYASDINLFKDDLKITNPKAGAKVEAQGLEIKWEPYPDAAYYKISISPDAGGFSPPVNAERVDDPVYSVAEPLTNGKYRLRVESYNANNRKLAETSDDIKFNVTGGAEPAPKP